MNMSLACQLTLQNTALISVTLWLRNYQQIMCVWMNINVSVCVLMNICLDKQYQYVCICGWVCVCVCVCVYARAFMRVCVCVFVYAYMRVHVSALFRASSDNPVIIPNVKQLN